MMALVKNPRLLWKRYIVAVGLILIFITGSHIASLQAARSSDDLANSINMSGRQRMLSQRILFLSGEIYHNNNTAENRLALGEAIDLFEQSHKELIGADLPNPASKMSARLKEIYFPTATIGLDAMVAAFVKGARIILSGNASQKDQAFARLSEMGQGSLLKQLDRAVFAYGDDVVDSVAQFKMIAMLSFILALMVLAAEAALIFWPAHRSIIRTLDELEQSNRELRIAEAITKQEKEAAEVARDAAQEGERVKAEFLANISHEVRTPMNGIQAMSSLLQRSELDEKQKEMAVLIEQSGDALVKIIDDILSLAQLEAGISNVRKSRFNLHDCIHDAMTQVRVKAAEKNLDFDLALSQNVDPWFFGDQKKIGQALRNVAENAVKFTERGSVSVAVDASPGATMTNITIAIADTGCGIAPDKQEIIFSDFEQADTTSTRVYGGTGIGLAISKRIMQALGGTLSVKSEVGTGSVFTLVIPLRAVSFDENVLYERLDEKRPIALSA
ncbi:MAG: hypothetical protein DHS20C05_06250 [Hyphococcus sp.]|nr:MAG: hypothetical protein DHS20C05_06250 [Marinicaulis sp.]